MKPITQAAVAESAAVVENRSTASVMSARTHWGWSVLAILALFCATVGLVYISVSISLVGGYVAALWPVNAIVLSLIATQPRHRWALILLVVWIRSKG